MKKRMTMMGKLKAKIRSFVRPIRTAKFNSHVIEFHGRGDGQWFILPKMLPKHPIVYSFGVGRNISFDTSLIDLHRAAVFAFDPTPISREWLERQILPDEFRFFPFGIGAFDGEIEMTLPETHGTSFSVARTEGDGRPIKVPIKKLESIMRELGHEKIDVLKMDVEGAEYDVIEGFDPKVTPAEQILVEFHDRLVGDNQASHNAIKKLEALGYVRFYASPRLWEQGFVAKRLLS